MKKFNNIKSILLVSLILISIFQTGELWFGSLPNRNFFYSFFQKNSYSLISDLDEPIHLLMPEKIIINFGVEGGAYSILKNTTKEFEAATEEMTEVLTNIFLNGENIIEEDLNWTKILSKKSILYKYPDIISTEGLTARSNISSKIPKFNQIIIVPNKSLTQNMNCYFVDETDEKVYRVDISNKVSLYELVNRFNEDIDEIIYISTKQRQINQFVNNVFLPTFNKFPTYQNIIMTNPVINNGNMDEVKLEKIINPLFSNPDLKKKQEAENGIIYYIEGNIMVKYFPEGFIEYTDQSGSGNNEDNMSFIEAYQVAKSFLDRHENSLEKEGLLENFIYLSKQSKTDRGWEFEFDFKIQDIPYVFSQKIINKIGMKHAVKIIVENNKVKFYKRLIWEGSLLDEEQEINIDYIQALEKIINELHSKGIENIEIDDMYWAYYQKELNTRAEIYWIVDIGGTLYPIKASK
ncbi:hypothetical protein [Defluviitalea phaphyphila]|uniref:hypothetical protein n=1 Tax=Defluviitalea phaphyphila TaxID=1473580 RepID=UPI00072FA678|nr:hypothetical protein [Defluviitalea phaphyphila]